MSKFLFKDRDGQTPLPEELQKGLKIKSIQTVGELDEFEEDNIARGLIWLEKQKVNPGKFDFWMKLHEKLFGNVWSWAGKVRKHELANPDFASAKLIWSQIYQLEADLNFWIGESGMPNEEISARFHERIETIHPFANGNGRFGRILTESICKYNKFTEPLWGGNLVSDSEMRRKAYIDALIAARRNREFSSLISFMFT